MAHGYRPGALTGLESCIQIVPFVLQELCQLDFDPRSEKILIATHQLFVQFERIRTGQSVSIRKPKSQLPR